MKAILRKTENEGMIATCPFSPSHEIEVKHGILYDFIYSDDNTFYLVVDGRIYEEQSTAFEFL